MLYVVDTEDAGGQMTMAVVHNGKQHWVFRTAQQFLYWAHKRRNFVGYAVNSAYDAGWLFRPVLRDLKFLASRSRLLRISHGKVALVDTLNHLANTGAGSVADMGEVIGQAKGELDPNSVDYCVNDCEITHKFYTRLLDAYAGVGVPHKLTVGGSAVATYRAKGGYLPQPRDSDIPGGFQKYCHKWRPCIYGGRTEVFDFNIKRGYYYADVNSMYVSVMNKGTWPDTCEPRAGVKLEWEGATEAMVDVSDCYIPPLPYRFNGKLLFPTGVLRGIWTNVELRWATDHGVRILKTYDGVHCLPIPSPFKLFTELVWNGRQESKDFIMNLVFKLLGNNLWGKFGQGNTLNKVGSYECEGCENPNCEDEAPEGAFLYPNTKWYSYEEVGDYPRIASPLWAGYTTAYARIKLCSALKALDDSTYCDTDSIVAKNADTLAQKGLGGWKVEHMAGSRGPFQALAPKLYRKGKEYRAKGVPKKTAKEYFEKGKADWVAPVKLKEAFRLGLDHLNEWVERSRQRRGTFEKRKKVGHGHTIPWNIHTDGWGRAEILN